MLRADGTITVPGAGFHRVNPEIVSPAPLRLLTKPRLRPSLAIMAMLDDLDPRSRARAIDELIQHLDAEDMLTEDCEPEEDADHTEVYGEGGDAAYLLKPRYGLNQEKGPINLTAAALYEEQYRAWAKGAAQ